MNDKDDHERVRDEKTELKFSIKIVSLGVQEQAEDLNRILEQVELSIQGASDALGHLDGPRIPGLPEQAGVAGAAASSVGSILNKFGKVADIMSRLSKVRSYTVAIRRSGLIIVVDSSLCKGSLGHSRPHSPGKRH